MKDSRRPKGEVSITKLPNGKLKMTLTLLWWYKELPVNYKAINSLQG